ncbi:MAG: hypothetical protein ACK56F_11265, partial [bacterium]
YHARGRKDRHPDRLARAAVDAQRDRGADGRGQGNRVDASGRDRDATEVVRLPVDGKTNRRLASRGRAAVEVDLLEVRAVGDHPHHLTADRRGVRSRLLDADEVADRGAGRDADILPARPNRPLIGRVIPLVRRNKIRAIRQGDAGVDDLHEGSRGECARRARDRAGREVDRGRVGRNARVGERQGGLGRGRVDERPVDRVARDGDAAEVVRAARGRAEPEGRLAREGPGLPDVDLMQDRIKRQDRDGLGRDRKGRQRG